MKNFYRLIQGDALKVLPTLEDESVDLIVIDPPYNLISSEWDKEIIDFSQLKNYFFLKLKRHGQLFIFGKIPMLINVFHYFSKHFVFRYETIWEKPNMIWVSDYKPLPVHENIWCFCKNGIDIKNLTFNAREVGQFSPYVRKGKTTSTEVRSGMKPPELVKRDIKLPRSVLKVANMDVLPKERLGHPTQKPEKLIAHLIKSSSDEGDVVLDCFLGSGTTMKVAQDLGRSCIGIEIGVEYCNMIKKRCFSRTFLDREVECKFEVFK